MDIINEASTRPSPLARAARLHPPELSAALGRPSLDLARREKGECNGATLSHPLGGVSRPLIRSAKMTVGSPTRGVILTRKRANQRPEWPAREGWISIVPFVTCTK